MQIKIFAITSCAPFVSLPRKIPLAQAGLFRISPKQCSDIPGVRSLRMMRKVNAIAVAAVMAAGAGGALTAQAAQAAQAPSAVVVACSTPALVSAVASAAY